METRSKFKQKKLILNDEERLQLREKLRLRSKINESNGCIEWQYGKGSKGYGCIYVKGKSYIAHRASWVAHNTEIPDGLLVCHKCDNPACINVDHLFLGTYSQNIDDMITKGRNRNGSENRIRKIADPNVKRKQIVFNVSEEFHRKIKVTAFSKGMQMANWIHRAMLEKLKRENNE